MIIYLVRLNGVPKYVGLTKNSLAKRWSAHVQIANKRPTQVISHAIAKHGPEAFTVEEIARAESYVDLCALERLYIAQYGTRTANGGYNLTDGGEGCENPSEETRRKMSEAKLGHVFGPMSDEHRANLSEAKKGKPKTAKEIATRTGMTYNVSAEGRAAHVAQALSMADGLRGGTHTPEQRAANSAAHTGLKQSAETVARRVAKTTGKKRTPEQRAKMQAGQIARREAERQAKLGNE